MRSPFQKRRSGFRSSRPPFPFLCTGSGDGLDHSLVRKEGAVMKKRIYLLTDTCWRSVSFYLGIQKTHTFTLADREGSSLKEEQIQPVFGTVQVSSSCDTAVVFTDTETGETYEIGRSYPGHTGEDPSAKRKVVYGDRRRRAYHGGGHPQDRIGGANAACLWISVIKRSCCKRKARKTFFCSSSFAVCFIWFRRSCLRRRPDPDRCRLFHLTDGPDGPHRSEHPDGPF